MVSIKKLLYLNRDYIYGMDIVGMGNNPHGVFALTYDKKTPVFYADGNMMPGTDDSKYHNMQMRPDGDIIYHRFVDVVDGDVHYQWQAMDMHGNYLTTMAGDEVGPQGQCPTVPVYDDIPSPVRAYNNERRFDFMADYMLYGGRYVVDTSDVWVRVGGRVYQIPLTLDGIASREIEFYKLASGWQIRHNRDYTYLNMFLDMMGHMKCIDAIKMGNDVAVNETMESYGKLRQILGSNFYGAARGYR